MSDPMPAPTAQVAPYVEVLGINLAVDFLLAFGGTEIYLTANPKSRSRVVEVIGREKTIALAGIAERLPRRVPLAKEWVAQVLFARGLSKAEIARTLHVSDMTVYGWLQPGRKAGRSKRGPDDGPVQLKLF